VKRGSRLILEANPGYREAYFPDGDRKEDAELVRSMKGRRVPFVGTVEVNVIDEDITRLLLFEQGGLDFVQLRGETATRLLADGKLKPEYAARGIARVVIAEPFLFSLYFNTRDPVLGGMSNDRIALRRAIALGWDTDTLIRVVLAGQAIPANQMIPPGVGGHDPMLPVKSLHDSATAKALLDRFGYDKRDPDGFRKAPDGSRLTLRLSLRTGGIMREFRRCGRRTWSNRSAPSSTSRRSGDHQGPGEREVPDVPGRLRRFAVGLQRARPAPRQAAAAGQYRAIRQCRLRPCR
jgi:ABC-type transport system substrate-binding protein